MGTKTSSISHQNALDNASPNQTADVWRKMQAGKVFSAVKVVVTGLSASATIDITAAATKAAATITGLELNAGENLPAIGLCRTLRVTASGTAASVIPHIVTDAGGTAAIPAATTAGANVGVATLSDDGKTLVFANTITAFTITYMPRPAVDMQSDFENGI